LLASLKKNECTKIIFISPMNMSRHEFFLIMNSFYRLIILSNHFFWDIVPWHKHHVMAMSLVISRNSLQFFLLIISILSEQFRFKLYKYFKIYCSIFLLSECHFSMTEEFCFMFMLLLLFDQKENTFNLVKLLCF